METTNLNAAIKLTKVAADYKLQTGEQFIQQGRTNKAFPNRPYFHTVASGKFPTMPTIQAMLGTDQNEAALTTALTKLWDAAVIELLKDKATVLDAGATITLVDYNQADVIKGIMELGNRERAAISGDEIEAFATTNSFKALAMVHAWTEAQQAMVIATIKKYAAPAFKLPEASAKVLATRFEPLTAELVQEAESASGEAETVLTVLKWLTTKLQRDIAATTTDLASAI